MERITTQLDPARFTRRTAITNERQLILQDFLTRLNAERGKYPPITASRLGVMLSVCTVSQLKQLYGDCNYARNFSSLFWWKIKRAKAEVIHTPIT